MKFNLPKIIVPIALSEYHEALGDAEMFVWVNLSLSKHQEYNELRAAVVISLDNLQRGLRQNQSALSRWWFRVRRQMPWPLKKTQGELIGIGESVYSWWSEIFSQSDDVDDHYSAEELQKLADTDPAFWQWLQKKAWRTMEEWREENKKKLSSKP